MVVGETGDGSILQAELGVKPHDAAPAEVKEFRVADLPQHHLAFREALAAERAFFALFFAGRDIPSDNELIADGSDGPDSEEEKKGKDGDGHCSEANAERDAVAEWNDRREKIFGGIDQPVVGEDPGGFPGRFLVENSSAPENVVAEEQSALPQFRDCLAEDPGVLMLVDVVEDDIELPIDLVDQLDCVAGDELHLAGEFRALEVCPGVLDVVGVVLRTDHRAGFSQRLCEPVGGIAETRPELEDPAGFDGPRDGIEEAADKRTHDREISCQGVLLHVFQNAVAVRRHAHEVIDDIGVNDIQSSGNIESARARSKFFRQLSD